MKKSINCSTRLAGLITNHAMKFIALCLAALLLLSNLSQVVSAAAGDLDPSFDGDGKVTTDFSEPARIVTLLISTGSTATAMVPNHGYASGNRVTISGAAEVEYNGTYVVTVSGVDTFTYVFGGSATTTATGTVTAQRKNLDVANAIAIQSDGKIVVAGRSTNASDPEGLVADFAIARYNPDGSLDPGFGTNGRVLTDFGGGDSVRGVVIQTDGKIVAGGKSSGGLALARYDADGSLDPGFGPNHDGKVLISSFDATALALQTDGRLVVAGTVNFDFALTRFNTDGSPDINFGTSGNGVVTTDFGHTEFANALAIQTTDGRIVVAGPAQSSSTGLYRFALARYNTDGSLDNTFGLGGRVVTGVSTQSFANALAIQTDGKVVAAGSFSDNTGNSGFALARYNTNGSLDNSFGTGGAVLTVRSGGEARALVIQTDGKIIAAGVSRWVLIGYNADGSVDTNFGPNGNGQLVTDFGGTDQANALALQGCRIVAAGGRSDFAVARYESSAGTACTISCPADITVVAATGQCGAIVNYQLPVVSGCCGTVDFRDQNNQVRHPGDFFPVGTTTLRCSASAGTSCSFTITVLDRIPPRFISLPFDRTITTDSSCTAVLPDLTGEVTASDDCTPASGLVITQSPSAGTRVFFDTAVSLTVRDDANNQVTRSVLIRVFDMTPPTITSCANDWILTPGVGGQAFIPDLTSGVSFTDCSFGFASQSPAAGTPVNVGTTTPVTIAVEDLDGNTSTCTASVTVRADADQDGIEDLIDRNKGTGADESQVFSNDFVRQDFASPATGPTFGTILERGRSFSVTSSGPFGVLASSTSVISVIRPCDKRYAIVLSRQQAHVTCDYQITEFTPSGPMQVLRTRIHNAGPFRLEVNSIGIRPGWRILIPRGQTVYLGSPITADAANDENITIEFLDGSENVIGSMELPPGQTVNIEQDAAGGFIITNLGTAPLTFTLNGVTRTLNPNETFVENQPPVARCRDVVKVADRNVTPQEVDAGSSDPEGQPLTLSLIPTGPYPLGTTAVTLTATDGTGASSQCAANVTINRGTQTINWGNPAPIVYGTALNAAQLNATATVAGPAPPGALSYTPPPGTVLNAGNGQTLTVTAAQTDNYNAATATVRLNVLKANPAFSDLSSLTVSHGTATTVLSGRISAGALIPPGSVAITLNGVTHSASIHADGSFSSAFATAALRVSSTPYTITYSYAGGNNFNAAGGAGALTLAYIDTVRGIVVTPAHFDDDGGTRFDANFTGLATGNLPGAFTAFVNYTPTVPGPNVTSTISGGRWALAVIEKVGLVPVFRGALVGTIRGGTVQWNADGTMSLVALQLSIDGGTQRYLGARGTGVFDNGVWDRRPLLLVPPRPPTIEGQLRLFF